MNRKLAVLATLWLLFLVYTAWVALARDPPLLSYPTRISVRSWNAQILADLAIALGLVCTWLIRDAHQRGKRAWPWVLATPVVGSLAPLLYLLLRELRKPS